LSWGLFAVIAYKGTCSGSIAILYRILRVMEGPGVGGGDECKCIEHSFGARAVVESNRTIMTISDGNPKVMSQSVSCLIFRSEFYNAITLECVTKHSQSFNQSMLVTLMPTS
jgi:hypothetical protein